MRKLLIAIAVIILIGLATNATSKSDSIINQIKSGVAVIVEQINIDELQQQLSNIFQSLKEENDILLNESKDEGETKDSPTLNIPEYQTFSVANIELGQSKSTIESIYGEAKRISLNEYNTYWHTYHDNYNNFFMVTYDKNNQVVGLFTNQNLISSKNGIMLGTTKQQVQKIMGKSLDSIHKEFIIYKLPKDRDYDLYEKDSSYITIFYDQHENNTVTAIQIIAKHLEDKKQDIYTIPTKELIEGFEYQLFDLTNAERVKHGLSVLTWDELVRITAREHSLDMAKNNYFSHTNLYGESPFDRMREDQIQFQVAGENLAFGQFSSIYAHEGLLNSLGHRENILSEDFEYLGVGVAFNDENQPYFTQKYFAK